MSLRERLQRARQSLTENMNVLFNRGPALDDDFWEDLEETLILSDLGAQASDEIVERLRSEATRKALPDAYAVLDLLSKTIEDLFAQPEEDPFDIDPVCILFVGINGAGKTTTVGKLANQALALGRKPLIGSADTFRAAAIEQLDEWGRRSGVEVVKRDRGADPASVCYDVIERGEELGSDILLIDTSGRLHTSQDLMRELEKVVNVTRKRAKMDVKVMLVIDATTGQNGLQQAREFNKALGLDGVIMTKLDGTAKGGIAVAVSHELGLPIVRIGVGESIGDLQLFDAHAYAEALFGEMRYDDGEQPDAEGGDPQAEMTFEPEEAPEPEDEPEAAEPSAEVTTDAVDEALEAEVEEELEEALAAEPELGPEAEPEPSVEEPEESAEQAEAEGEEELAAAGEDAEEANGLEPGATEAEPELEGDDEPMLAAEEAVAEGVNDEEEPEEQPEPEPEQPAKKRKWWEFWK